MTAPIPVGRLALASIGVALAVLGLKLLAWWITGSVALYSDALESTVNVAAAAVAYGAVRLAEKPADANHPYGHTKAEYISAVIEGVMIVLAAIAVLRAAWGAFIAPEAILSADVDILSPNAMGAVLSAQTVPTIRARAICGCANNQLATPEVAHLLTERGILWAPDYVVSAGGAIDGCKDAGILSAEERDARIAGIGTTLTTIFDLATRGNTTTEAAAQALARDAVENV